MLDVKIEGYQSCYHFDDVLVLDIGNDSGFVKIERKHNITYINKREILGIEVQPAMEVRNDKSVE